MKYFNKTHAIIMLIILLAYSQITLHQKLENLESQLLTIQSEVLNTRSTVSNQLYQLNRSEQMYHFEGFNVIDHALDLEKETLTLSFELTFTKMPINGEVKLEISDTDKRLIAFDLHGYEQPNTTDAIYVNKAVISLDGQDNRFKGEMVLDLNKNYNFALLVGDGNEQSKESIGIIAAQEWFKSPSTISVAMRGLSIAAPSSGQFHYDLFIGNQNSREYRYDYYHKSLFTFDAIERIPSNAFKAITYRIYYKDVLLDTFEVTDMKWENDAIKITDSVKFVSDINASDSHIFKFVVTLTTLDGETFESEYIAAY